MNFTTFSAVLTIFRHNFKILHWGASGKKFDRIHNLAEDYANMVNEDLDVIAEMGMRCGQHPVSMCEAIETIEHVDEQIVCLDYKEFSFKEFVAASTVMLGTIMKCIATLRNSDEMQKDCNMGIKASLEAMYDKYDLQARYLNARRSDSDD